jgi:cell wall-associated NlpC family hydrolase
MKIMSKTLAVSLCSAIMLGVVGVPGALADSKSKTTNSSSATATTGLTYVVVKNDSLTGIASKTKVKFNDLLAVNGFKSSSVILPGQVIKLPDAAVVVTVSVSGAVVAAAPAIASSATYTVVKNDSLSGIASKAKVSLSAFLAVNGFTKKSVIRPGQIVKLPEGSKVSVITAAVASTNAAPSRMQVVLDFAKAQVGKPYEFGKAGPTSYDCSGLTKAAFAQVKVSLPHQSLLQSKLGTAIDWKSVGIQAGDLVFTYSTKNTTQISHVGIAISATQWIEAPYTGGSVRISTLPSASKIQAVQRVL